MDRVYEKSLRPLSFGRPLYHAVPNLQPGHCGYFDANGLWHHIFDLSSLMSHAPNLVTKDPIEVGPLFGGSMAWKGCKAEIEIRIPNFPPGAGFSLGFETQENESGLLLSDPIQYKAYEPYKPLRDWIKFHGREEIGKAQFSDAVAEYGLFLITQVYCTKRCKVAAVLGSGQKLSVQCIADGFQAGKINLGGGWSTIVGACASQDFGPKDGVEYAVFAGGFHYRPSWVFWPVRPWNPCIMQMPAMLEKEGDRIEEEYVDDETIVGCDPVLQAWSNASTDMEENK